MRMTLADLCVALSGCSVNMSLQQVVNILRLHPLNATHKPVSVNSLAVRECLKGSGGTLSALSSEHVYIFTVQLLGRGTPTADTTMLSIDQQDAFS